MRPSEIKNFKRARAKELAQICKVKLGIQKCVYTRGQSLPAQFFRVDLDRGLFPNQGLK